MQIAAEYGVDPQQVLVTAGATQANLVATATALDLGGEYPPEAETAEEAHTETDERRRALVEKPGYEPLVKTPEALGAAVDRFLRAEGYELDHHRVEKALTPDTDLVTVTNRHNPSGRLTDRERLAEVAKVVSENGARLLVDEVYAPYVPSEDTVDENGAFGGVSAVGLDDVVVTGSLTKFFGLGELRVGWLVADEAFVERAQSIAHYFARPADPSRTLAMRAFHNEEHLAERSRTLLEENADLLSSFVAERDDVTGYVDSGSTFAFLDPKNVDGNRLAERAWSEGSSSFRGVSSTTPSVSE
ncbi:pyridoxal phosphate-dependent aminotransferase [Halospeciosus flavus]|uniref:pyridoxal phosphate-dependent aminotransferase n=1 Tax=Halospeciosus flavus TaxID=3032283 RepID=UPI003621AC10